MSCKLRLNQPGPVLKALAALGPSRDAWVTFDFPADAPTVVFVHFSAPDGCSTATATLPDSLFHEVHVARVPQPEGVDTCRFSVSLSAVTAALHLTQQTAVHGAHGLIELQFPSVDGQVRVSACDDALLSTCSLTVRPSKPGRLHDLRFGDALVPNRVLLRGDLLREWVQDLAVAAVEQIHVACTASTLRLHGVGSPFASVTIEVDRGAESVLAFESGDDGLCPKFLAAQALHALAAGSLAGSPDRGSSGVGSAAPFGQAFPRVQIRINTEGQLSVTHMPHEHEAGACVEFVVQPLASDLE